MLVTVSTIHINYNNNMLPELFQALEFAAHCHRQQQRKDGSAPYINHPIAVASLIINNVDFTLFPPYWRYDVATAALLHDTVEDTDATLEQIEENFGKKVRDYVAEVSDDKTLPKGDRKRVQWKKTPSKSLEAQLIKLADKQNNCLDITRAPPPHWDLPQAQGYFSWSRAIIRDIIPNLPPTCQKLGRVALEITEGTFEWKGEVVPKVPVPDDQLDEYVEEYLNSFKK